MKDNIFSERMGSICNRGSDLFTHKYLHGWLESFEFNIRKRNYGNKW
jgi:hypothetical protein